MLAATLCLTAGAERASAADADAAAAKLLAEAADSFADGALVQARTLLEQAMGLTRRPSLLGRAHLQLGVILATENRLEEARHQFRQALELDRELDLDETRHKRAFVALFRAVREEMQGVLEVEVDRQDIDVVVGTRSVGHSPVRLRLFTGDHRVGFKDAAGNLLAQSMVKIVAGKTTRFTLALPVPRATTAGAATSARPPGGLPATNVGAGQTKPRRRIWTWVALGASAAAAAAAIALGAASRADGNKACGLLADPSTACEDRSRLADPAQRERYVSLYQGASDKALYANIAWGTAATLAAGAALLYWLEGRGAATSEPRPSRPTVLSSVGTAGVALQINY